MSWFNLVPQFLVAVAIVFVPGAAVAWTSRVRGFALVAVAPAISVTLIAVSAVLAPMLGLRWSLIPVLGLTAVITLVAFAAAWLVTRRARVPLAAPVKGSGWMNAAGCAAAVVIAAFLTGRRVGKAINDPSSFSQTFDNVFHLNAIRYIQDTGSGSSLTLNAMTGGVASFYPAAWHDVVSLLVSVTGAGITTSVNVVNILVASLVWPLGCIFLAHKVLGNRPAVSLTAGVLSAAFGAFPMSLLHFGVLYPNFLGNALLPIVLALGVQALGLSRLPSRSRTLDWLLFLTVLPGMTLAHPSSTMALFALMIPPLLVAWGRSTAAIVRGARSTRWLAVAGMVAALAAGAVLLNMLWTAVRPPENAAIWPTVETTGQAIGEVISSSGIGRPVAWAVMALVCIGLVLAVVNRNQRWLFGAYLMAAALFVVVASAPDAEFRMFVTGIWYNDPPRLAALLPLVTVPLAAGGAVWLWDKGALPWLSRGLEAVGRNRKVPAAGGTVGPAGGPEYAWQAAAAVVLIGVLGFTTQQENVQRAESSMADSYRLTNDSALVSTDEMALIERLPDEVPEDAVMVGNPWNGSALAYAFAGRKLLQLHILSAVPDGGSIINGLNAAKADPSVCENVKRLQVQYVLDFGHYEVHGGESGYRGLDNLVAAGVATLQDSEGEARLYKINACWN